MRFDSVWSNWFSEARTTAADVGVEITVHRPGPSGGGRAYRCRVTSRGSALMGEGSFFPLALKVRYGHFTF